MIAQMSLVSLSVKLAPLPGVVGALVSSMACDGRMDGYEAFVCASTFVAE
jgi:hypothetical protein